MFTLFTNDGQLTVGPTAPELPSVDFYVGSETSCNVSVNKNVLRLSVPGVMVAIPFTDAELPAIRAMFLGITRNIEKTASESGAALIDHPACILQIPTIGPVSPRNDQLIHYEIDYADFKKTIRHSKLGECPVCIASFVHSKATITLNVFSTSPKAYEILAPHL